MSFSANNRTVLPGVNYKIIKSRQGNVIKNSNRSNKNRIVTPSPPPPIDPDEYILTNDKADGGNNNNIPQTREVRNVKTMGPVKLKNPILGTSSKVTFDNKYQDNETEEQTKERLKQEELLTSRVVKNCPLCGKATYQDGGCNYMKCSDSDPKSPCPQEWCFIDNLPKYRPITGKEYLGCCNDQSHNSH